MTAAKRQERLGLMENRVGCARLRSYGLGHYGFPYELRRSDTDDGELTQKRRGEALSQTSSQIFECLQAEIGESGKVPILHIQDVGE